MAHWAQRCVASQRAVTQHRARASPLDAQNGQGTVKLLNSFDSLGLDFDRDGVDEGDAVVVDDFQVGRQELDITIKVNELLDEDAERAREFNLVILGGANEIGGELGDLLLIDGDRGALGAGVVVLLDDDGRFDRVQSLVHSA